MDISKPILIISLVVGSLALNACAMAGKDYYQVSNPVKKDRLFGIKMGNSSQGLNTKKGNYRFINAFNGNKSMRMKARRNSGNYVGGVPAKSAKSYHFGNGTTTPKSHKQRDTEWINSQNPADYTIELASEDNAQGVAETIFKTPKEQRMAQYKQEHQGKTVHTGIYGSFASREAAKEALDKLPDDVKGKAKVKSWGKAQNEARTVASASQVSSTELPKVKTDPKQDKATASEGGELVTSSSEDD